MRFVKEDDQMLELKELYTENATAIIQFLMQNDAVLVEM